MTLNIREQQGMFIMENRQLTAGSEAMHSADDLVAIRELAALEFEPWIPGQGAEMTPALLTRVASEGPFLAAYLAYKTMFRTKDQLVESCRAGSQTSINLVDTLHEGAHWLETIAEMMRGAAARHMSAVAVAELDLV